MRSQVRPEILFQKAIMRRGNGFDYDLVADLKVGVFVTLRAPDVINALCNPWPVLATSVL